MSFSIFCCRKNDPAMERLITEYSDIQSESIVKPYLRKNLDEDQLQKLRVVLDSEREAKNSLGETGYKSLLKQVKKSSVTHFISDEEAFQRYGKTKGETLVDLSRDQKIGVLRRYHRRDQFKEQLPQKIGPYPNLDVQSIVEYSFPRFVSGRSHICDRDWRDIDLVLQTQRPQPIPRDALISQRFATQWRLVDLLKKERAFAIGSQSKEGAAQLDGWIQEKKKALRKGPIYPTPLNGEPHGTFLEEEHPVDQEDYCIYPMGNLIRDPDAKLAFIDWTGVSQAKRDEMTMKVPFEQLNQVAPGVRIPYGPAHIFYEKPSDLIQSCKNLEYAQNWKIEKKGRFYKRIVTEDVSKEITKRTAKIERLEFLAILEQLRKEIIEGRAGQITWNEYLNIHDYQHTIRSHPSIRIQHPELNDENFKIAIRDFNQISEEMLKWFKERILVDQLESIKDRNYDLPSSVKTLAEISKMLTNWIDSIETVLDSLNENPKLKRDFSWFDTELSQILPVLKMYQSKFPLELIQLENRSPSDIENNYPSIQLESWIERTLAFLSSDAYRSFPQLIVRLQVAQNSKALADAQTRLLHKHAGQSRFQIAFQTAIPNAFQVPSRIALCMKTVVDRLSQPSRLQRKILEAYQTVQAVLLDTEKLRLDESRRDFSMTAKEALKRYFPTL